MNSYGATFVIIVLGMFFVDTGFTKHNTSSGLFPMWVGVIYTLAIINYRIHTTTHY